MNGLNAPSVFIKNDKTVPGVLHSGTSLAELVTKITNMFNNVKKKYKNVVQFLHFVQLKNDLQDYQLQAKVDLDKQLGNIVELYSIIWEIIMFEDKQYLKDVTFNHPNYQRMKIIRPNCNIVNVINIGSLEEMETRIIDLFNIQYTNEIDLSHIPFTDDRFYEAFPGKPFFMSRQLVKIALMNGNVPFAITLTLDEFSNSKWMTDTWITIKSFDFNNE